jgi:hypothetical protein
MPTHLLDIICKKGASHNYMQENQSFRYFRCHYYILILIAKTTNNDQNVLQKIQNRDGPAQTPGPARVITKCLGGIIIT